mmetsp:Transcript_37689/g.63430  ORF Transcript_37689/g.63430 Transcript_37689/m.63430 type:complete len:401 (+) Transcript_37689:372-1574(+)
MLVCEPDEHLFECGLRDGVVLHQFGRGGVGGLGHRLHCAEQPREVRVAAQPVLEVCRVVLEQHSFGNIVLHIRLHHLGVLRLDAEIQTVAFTVLVLQVLKGPEGPELALDHDADAVAQRFTLFHRVRREHHAAVLHGSGDDIPHEASRFGVHASGGLVQKHHGRVSHQSDGDAELALVAAAVRPGQPVRIQIEVHAVQQGVDRLLDLVSRHPPHAAVEPQVLAPGHVGLDAVELGAVANQLAGIGDVVHDGEEGVGPRGVRPALDGGIPGGWDELPREHAEGGRLARPVDAQQAEALPAANTEAERAHRREVVAVGLSQPFHKHHRLVAGGLLISKPLDALLLRHHVLVFTSLTRRRHPLREHVLLVDLDENCEGKEEDALEEKEQHVVPGHHDVVHVPG